MVAGARGDGRREGDDDIHSRRRRFRYLIREVLLVARLRYGIVTAVTREMRDSIVDSKKGSLITYLHKDVAYINLITYIYLSYL